MTEDVSIIVDAPSEANSSYHAGNLAILLAERGARVGVEFRQVQEGPVTKQLVAANVSFRTMEARSRKSKVLYLWGARPSCALRRQSIASEHLILHIEDNDFEVFRKGPSLGAMSDLTNLFREADVISYVNPAAPKLWGRQKASQYLIRPGLDDRFATHHASEVGELHSHSTYVLYLGNCTGFVLEGLTRAAIGLQQASACTDFQPILIVTGRDYTNQLALRFPTSVLSCGFLPRESALLLAQRSLANIQVGATSAFDDYRFPSKFTDYFRAMRPVLTPNIYAGLALKGGHNALVVAPDTPEGWTCAFRDVLEMPESSRRDIAQVAYREARRELSWARSTEPLLNHIMDLVI